MKRKIVIDGMSCSHCVNRVQKALLGVAGVTDASVDLKSKSAVVMLSETVTDESLKAAVEDAGYDVLAIEAA